MMLNSLHPQKMMPNLIATEISSIRWPTIFSVISVENVVTFSKLLQNAHYFHPTKHMKTTMRTHDVKQSAPTKYYAKFIFYGKA